MSSNGRFATLDGMRGLAAFVVAAAHVGELIGFGLPPQAELAVDFFFVLSGFVIAQAYETRLATSLTLVEFLKIRIIRLHPLMLLGCAISLCLLVTESILGSGPGPGAILWAVIAATLLIPFHTLPSPGAFPLDGPAWSLFAEYWVNILFAMLVPFLTTSRLRGLLVIGVAALISLFLIAGGIGNVWQNDTIGLSILRVLFPFFAGVMLSRLYRARKIQIPRVSPVLSIAALAAILLSPEFPLNALFQFTMIVVVFPLLVLASTHDEMGPKQRRIMLLGGELSYPIYTLHFPLALVFVVPVVGPVVPLDWNREALGLFLCLLCGLSYLALRYFDEPVRAWLTAQMRSRTARSVAA